MREKTQHKYSKLKGLISIFLIYAICFCSPVSLNSIKQANNREVSLSSTLSPQIIIQQNLFEAVFADFAAEKANQSMMHNRQSKAAERLKKDENIRHLFKNKINLLKDKWSTYWDYYRPLYKKFRLLDFEDQEIKPVLKALLKDKNIYIAARDAEVIYNLAKYLLSKELNFLPSRVCELITEISGENQARKIAIACFDIIELLQKEGFDQIDIQKIMQPKISNRDFEVRLEQIRYRLKKMELMKIVLWRKKEALISREYFETLLTTETDRAKQKIVKMIEGIKQEMQEPVVLGPRVMRINIHELLTNRINMEQLYQFTIDEINFEKNLLAGSITPTKGQQEIIENTDGLLHNFLNGLGLNFDSLSVYFVPNETMPYLTDGVFLPYHHVVASCAEINQKALFCELIHEGLHANSQGFVPTRLNEGMTEYLRNKLLMLNAGIKELTYEKIIDHHYDNFSPRYVTDLKVILLLLYNFGEEALFNAYFFGDDRALENALGPMAWEELKELAFCYEYADEGGRKEYPEKAEKLLKKYFPDLKTFDTEENETALMDYIKPESMPAALVQESNSASAIAARLNGRKIYPFDDKKGTWDIGSGYILDVEIPENNPSMVRVFLARENQGQRSKEPVMCFDWDNNGVKDMSIALEYMSFYGSPPNKSGDYLTGKKLGIQLMSYLGAAVSAGMTIEGQVHNEPTRKELSVACYVDSSGRARLKKVWNELAEVGTKDRILFLSSKIYGKKDEDGDFFIVDGLTDYPEVDKEQKIHIQDVLSRTVIGKLRETGGFFKHSIIKLLQQDGGKLKQGLSGVEALRWMLNNLERSEFMTVQGEIVPTFTLISEKIESDSNSRKETALPAEDKPMIQRQSYSGMDFVEQAI